MSAHKYNGIFHDYLAYLAVASANHESLGSNHAGLGNMNRATSHFLKANRLKEDMAANLARAHEGFHNMIGDYGCLVGHSPEVEKFLHSVVAVAGRLEDRAHDWHVNAMLHASEEQRKD